MAENITELTGNKMFADMTYERILAGMLARVTSAVDKREGSLIWDALAPAAWELTQLYAAMEQVLAEGFADTASREYLILRARERGIEPYAATAAIGLGRTVPQVAIGERFLCGQYTWRVVENLSDGACYLRCETAGSEPNACLGRLLPVAYISGLQTAELVDIVTPGEDEEATEALRARYLNSLTEQSFGGNRADYIEKAGAIPGVGGVKVYPAWQGGGTVRLAILDAAYGAPSEVLLAAVQETIDPPEQGSGLGLAPIGHVVTVTAAEELPVSVTAQFTLQTDWLWADIEAAVQTCIDQYFRELAQEWAATDALVVRLSQLEARLLDLAGVLDITGLQMNGVAGNLLLGADQIPVRGDLDVAV